MFRPGDTVVFSHKNYTDKFWDSMTHEVKLRYFGCLGYGRDKPLLFTYLCEHSPQIGHCVLVNMENQKIETMVHISDLDLYEDE